MPLRSALILSVLLPGAALAQSVPVFTPGDEGRPFVDLYSSGLYSADCVQGEGCTCTAMAVDREGLALALGVETVAADVQGWWRSPATEGDLTAETPEALHARFGGTGYCPQAPLEPRDGLWRDGTPFNLVVACGEGTAMFRQVLMSQPQVTARIAWGGVFSGDTIQTAFIAADPDPENTPHDFSDVTPVETRGEATLTEDGVTMRSSARMRLLSPTLFTSRWEVVSTGAQGPCNWSFDHLVRWIGE